MRGLYHMQVLSIGNSFSCDAHRYLRRIAEAGGAQLTVVNLYIGGCSLERHYRNMLSGSREYGLEINGFSTGFKVSLQEALLNRRWDVVTLQQASHFSPYYESYQPYINKLAEYIRTCLPKAKVLIHQTWAYEQGSARLCKELGYTDQKQMYDQIVQAYDRAAEDICADGIIPSGTLFQKLLAGGAETVHRDTFHASLGLGRYALGLLWYAVLTGRDVCGNPFADFDEPVSPEHIALAQRCVSELAAEQASKR